jgi:uncharacterized damage-inducible protein DinB
MLLRPNEEEYEKAFSRYISLVPEGNFFDHLQAQTEQNRNYFGRLSEEGANYRYAPNKWSLKEVLGHVMDAERIFTCRALCIARGEQQPLPGFDEQEYARVAGYDQLPLQKVLQQYDAIRLSTRLLLEQLPDSAWTTKGTSNQKPISVRALAYIIAGHERHHMGVIAERYGQPT